MCFSLSLLISTSRLPITPTLPIASLPATCTHISSKAWSNLLSIKSQYLNIIFVRASRFLNIPFFSYVNFYAQCIIYAVNLKACNTTNDENWLLIVARKDRRTHYRVSASDHLWDNGNASTADEPRGWSLSRKGKYVWVKWNKTEKEKFYWERDLSDLSPSPLPSPSLLAELGCRPLLPPPVSSGRTSSLLWTVKDDFPFFPKPSRRFRPSSPTHVPPTDARGMLWILRDVI